MQGPLPSPSDQSKEHGRGGSAPHTTTADSLASTNSDRPPSGQDRQRDSRFLRMAYRLVTANLWLRTAIMAIFSVALIVASFQWHVITRPNIWSYLAAQLGTGLLVVAVGAALVQSFIMSSPETLRKLMNELGAESRVTSHEQITIQLNEIKGATTVGLRSLESQVSQLVADMQRHDFRSSMPEDRALHQAGIAAFYDNVDDSMASIMSSLKDPRVTTIRLLGLSLADWFRRTRTTSGTEMPIHILEATLRGERSTTERSRPVNLEVLLLDPRCAAARLLMSKQREPDIYEKRGRFYRDTERTARHLIRLGEEVARLANGGTVEVRFYRIAPSFFALSTDVGSFVRPYYVGLDTGQADIPYWQYGSDSRTHSAVSGHFEAIWRYASIKAEEALSENAYGTDQGISEAGIANVYTDLKDAEDRITWLISNATDRVWMQGISLVHHVSAPLIDSVTDLVRKKNVDVRFLILDPNCEEAYRKSFRDYVLDREGDETKPLFSFEEYCANRSLHEESAVYRNIRYATQILTGILGGRMSGPASLRHYTCAPTSYVLIADNRALVEQFHYGKAPLATDSSGTRLQLAREMPLIELERPQSGLYEAHPYFDPLSVMVDHFGHVFERYSHSL